MAAVDNFASNQKGLSTPLTHIVAAAADDANDLPFVTRAVYVSETSDLQILTKDGDTVTLPGIIGGLWHPIRAKRILSGTTAESVLIGE